MAAPKGNDYNLKYTLDEAKKALREVIDHAIDNKCLSVQEAVITSKLPYSTYYYLTQKYANDLGSLKQELNDVIIMEINKGALKADFVASPAIWRMKQLGETDKSEITTTSLNTVYIEKSDKDELERHILEETE